MKRCVECNKKIKELKKRQTPDYCSDECAYETILGEKIGLSTNYFCFSNIAERKTARQLFPSLIEDEDIGSYGANARMAMEDF